jgi:hypothetical protein
VRVLELEMFMEQGLGRNAEVASRCDVALQPQRTPSPLRVLIRFHRSDCTSCTTHAHRPAQPAQPSVSAEARLNTRNGALPEANTSDRCNDGLPCFR